MDEIEKKILIIDDNSVNITALKSVFSKLYKVLAVNSGITALKLLEKQRPDLILLDIEMPEMNGREVLKVLKENSELSDIPVIFLTANQDEESEAEAFLLGAEDFLRKPMNEVIGLARVKMHLELSAYRHS